MTGYHNPPCLYSRLSGSTTLCTQQFSTTSLSPNRTHQQFSTMHLINTVPNIPVTQTGGRELSLVPPSFIYPGSRTISTSPHLPLTPASVLVSSLPPLSSDICPTRSYQVSTPPKLDVGFVYRRTLCTINRPGRTMDVALCSFSDKNRTSRVAPLTVWVASYPADAASTKLFCRNHIPIAHSRCLSSALLSPVSSINRSFSFSALRAPRLLFP